MAKKENRMPDWQLPYEKKINSQSGEDGIIEVMLDAINVPRNNTFLEIGWGDGGTNMTWYLMEQKGWGGVGVDARAPRKGYDRFPPNFKHYQELVYPYTCTKYLNDVPLDCDFFSLDIDSFDYEVAKVLLEAGFRPKTICVEINKNFGSESVASFPFIKDAVGKVYHKLFFNGVSLEKYKRLFSKYGYKFFTVDSTIVNALFYREDVVDNSLENLPVLDKEYIGSKDMVKYWLENNISPKERLSGLVSYWRPKMNQIWKE